MGETLTADPSGITDADGLDNVSYAYQWLRNDGTTGTNIQGATSATYTLADADEGKTIKVKVSFTDDAGNEEVLTSAATDAVAPRPNRPAGGAPVITGAPLVEETLTADTSGITDDDGLENTTYAYQWMANDGNGDADISGANGSSYTLASADQGKTIRVRCPSPTTGVMGRSSPARPLTPWPGCRPCPSPPARRTPPIPMTGRTPSPSSSGSARSSS